jgi:hypothetical protein
MIMANFCDALEICVFQGCPSSWDWWIVHVVSLVVMVVLGKKSLSLRVYSTSYSMCLHFNLLYL